MIEVKQGDILRADAEALVNTVNCVGIMGRGIALQFKKAFPDSYFNEYKTACDKKELRPGTMLVHDLQPMLVLLMACGFLSASYNGPIYAVIVTIAGPRLRGLAVSMVQLGANLIGVGAGTYLIGAVSDYVGGNEGIAWGIGIAMLFTFAGGLMLLMASRAIRRAAVQDVT